MKNNTVIHNKIQQLLLILIIVTSFLGSWYFLHGTLNFHTDIARDFLLLEDVVDNKNITLIGPRSGGIPGVFHGPLWIYLNVPAYIIGQGNPVVVGWFWFLLFIASVYFVYYSGSKLFDKITGLLAALFYSSVLSVSVHSMFNPFGAVLFFPLFFYFFYSYHEKQKPWDLIICLFLIGVIIQFQMAFGLPLLTLILPYILYLIIKNKKYKQLLILPVIFIPLSSFILFEVRNDFLQTKSVINYISGVENAGKVKDSFPVLILNRTMIMLREGIGMVTHYQSGLAYIIVGLFIYSLRKVSKKNLQKYQLFLFLFLGFWIITLAYKGVMWGYYFWPFAGGIAIIFASLWNIIDKKVFIVIFGIMYISNIIGTLNSTVKNPLLKTDNSLWGFYKNVAEEVYADAPAEFGYYVYTTDQFGYSSRYAMNYEGKKHPEKKAFPYEKKSTTYLLIDDDKSNRFTNNIDWKMHDVKIIKKPVHVFQKNKTYVVEKFNLNEEEVSVQSNPNLIHTLIFR